MKKWIAVLVILFVFCSAAGAESAMRPMVGVATDYTLAENWLQFPAITKAVDTIYFYPTTYVNPAADAPGGVGRPGGGARVHR